MFKKISGTKDILPEEAFSWQKIEAVSRRVFQDYNYRECRPPMIEEARLFDRSLGESSEIVQKQMFMIKSGEDAIALRPEGTASVVRLFLENDLDKTSGFTKLYYMGPMFRYERPQKGRQRQFHHIGVEAIGSYDPALDVEVVSLADRLLKEYGIDGYEIKLNSIGCAKDKKELSALLHNELKDKIAQFCPDCQRRYKVNILRVLDCKNEPCKEAIKSLELKEAHLCPECKADFAKVRDGLASLKIDYSYIPTLVRGLDYYTGTVFEIAHPELGSQDALGAGGRYNDLVHELGGPKMGAVGFAFGVERILLVTSQCEAKRSLPGGDKSVRSEAEPPRRGQVTGKNLTYLITLGDEARKFGIGLISRLRNQGIACDTDYESKSLKGAMRKANDLQAKFALIIGEDELKKNAVTLKNMVSGEQKEVKFEELDKELAC